MQNEPNFKNTQMNLNLFTTTDYGTFHPPSHRKNEPNFAENKPNLVRHPVHRSLPPSGLGEDGSLWRNRIKPNFTRYKFYLQITDASSVIDKTLFFLQRIGKYIYFIVL